MKLSVNEKGLLANLESVFSDNTKVITELVQNARRSGASVINIQFPEPTNNQVSNVTELCITDDGCGIDDLTSLFTVAESGWSDDVAHAENPYGMGFMATLFAAEAIEVKSNGQSLAFNTKDAIDGKDIGEATPDGTAPKQGTMIRLKGMDCRLTDLKLALKAASEYCETPVIINGEPAEQPYAFSKTSAKDDVFVFETELGTAVMSSLSKSEPQVVLQEMRVYSPFSASSEFFFYANEKVKARMPDRDKIINESEVVKTIRQQVSDKVVGKLVSIRKEMNDDETFVDTYYRAILTHKPELSNEIDVLPAKAFLQAEYPSKRTETFRCRGNCKAVRKGDKSVEVITTDDIDIIGVVASMYAFEKSAQIPECYNELPDNHWLFDQISDYQSHEFVLHVEKEFGFSANLEYNNMLTHENDSVIYGAVHIENESTGETVECESGLCLNDDDYCVDGLDDDGFGARFRFADSSFNNSVLLLADEDICIIEDVLLQGSSYQSEFDEQLATELEIDAKELSSLIDASRESDVEKLIQKHLKDLPTVVKQRIAQSQFNLQADENGEVSVSKAA